MGARLENQSHRAGSSISDRSLLDLIALIPPRFGEWFGRGEKTMKLYHFPSPNPQKVTFALLELGLDCEQIPVDLAKREQREPAFLAVNPAGRVPVLVDDG